MQEAIKALEQSLELKKKYIQGLDDEKDKLIAELSYNFSQRNLSKQKADDLEADIKKIQDAFSPRSSFPSMPCVDNTTLNKNVSGSK